jgi:hypothetical protein
VRTIRLLFTAVVFGALTLSVAFAGETNPQPDKPVHSEQRASSPPAKEDHAAQPRNDKEAAGQTSPNDKRQNRQAEKLKSQHEGVLSPRHLIQNPGLSKNLSGVNASLPTSKKPAQTSTEPGTKPNLPHVPNPAAVSPLSRPFSVPALPMVATRKPGAAALGGPAITSAKNNGVLNGTGMAHKP